MVVYSVKIYLVIYNKKRLPTIVYRIQLKKQKKPISSQSKELGFFC